MKGCFTIAIIGLLVCSSWANPVDREPANAGKPRNDTSLPTGISNDLMATGELQPTTVTATTFERENVTTPISRVNLPSQPTATPPPPTIAPTTATTTIQTTTTNSTTPAPTTSTTTKETTLPTIITTVSPKPSPKPTEPNHPTELPTVAPSQGRKFDGPSFIGGIVLAGGLCAIGYIGFKFYKARTENNYHTL